VVGYAYSLENADRAEYVDRDFPSAAQFPLNERKRKLPRIFSHVNCCGIFPCISAQS